MMKTKLCYKEFTSRNGFEELIEEINRVIHDASLIISIKSEEKFIEHIVGHRDKLCNWIEDHDVIEYKIKIFYKEQIKEEIFFPG